MLVNKVFMHLMIQSVTDSLVTLRQCQYPILNVSPSLTPRPWCYQEGWIQMSISGGTPKIGHWKVTCTLDLALEIADGHGIQTDIYNNGSMVAHIWAVFHFGGLVPKEAGIVSVIFSWHQGLATKGNIRRCKCGKSQFVSDMSESTWVVFIAISYQWITTNCICLTVPQLKFWNMWLSCHDESCNV